MWLHRARPLFIDRKDAGEKLAPRLIHYRDSQAIVMAVPRGGVEVGAPLAQALDLPLDVLVVRKLPIPWNPEMGMGAVTAEGFVLLDEPLVREIGLGPAQVEKIAQQVRQEIERRRQLYRGDRPEPQWPGKIAIIVDDGLATGYTVLAAIKSLRSQRPEKIVVAVPVASTHAASLVEAEADEFIALAIADTASFAVADYYHHWTDLSDAEVMTLLHPQPAPKVKTPSPQA